MKKRFLFSLVMSIILATSLCANAAVTKQFAEEGATTGEMTWIGEDFESYTVGTEVASGTNNGMYSSAALKIAGDESNKYLLINQAVATSSTGGLFLAPNSTDMITLTAGNRYIYNIDFMVATDTNKWNVTTVESTGVRFAPGLNFGENTWKSTSTGWEFNCYSAPTGIKNNSNATDFSTTSFNVNKWSNFKLVLEAAEGTEEGKVNLTATAYVNGTLASKTNQTSTLSDVANVISAVGITNMATANQAYGYTLALDNMYLSVYDEDLMESYKAVKEYDANGNLTYIGDDFENHTPGVFGVTNTNLLGQGDYYLNVAAEVAKDEDGNKYLITKQAADAGLILITPNSSKSFALTAGKKYIYNLDFRAEPTSWSFTTTGTAIRPKVGYSTAWTFPKTWQIDYTGAKYVAETAATATSSETGTFELAQYNTGDKLKEILYTGSKWNNLQVIIDVAEGTADGKYKLTTKMLVNGVMMGETDMTAPAEAVITDSAGIYSFGVEFRQTLAEERIIHFDNFYITEYSDSLVTKADKNLTVNSASIESDSTTASISFKPVTQSQTEKVTVILAAYDNSGSLIGAKVEQNVEIEKFNFAELSKASLDLPSGTKTVKGFIWNSLTDLVPLASIEPIEY